MQMARAGLAALLPILISAGFSTALSDGTTYEDVYDQLMNIGGGSGRVATVSNLVIRRDVAEFSLSEGKMYLLSAVGDRTVGAMFLGQGTFSFDPVTDVERKQLARFYDTESLEKPFKVLFMLFADSTAEELEGKLNFSDGTLPKDVRSNVEYALKYVSTEKSKDFSPEIIGTFLNGLPNDLFYAHVSEKKSDPTIFEINPYATEEVQLRRRVRMKKGGEVSEVICQGHLASEYVDGLPVSDVEKAPLRVDHYDIEGTIAKNLDFSAKTEVTVEWADSALQWFPFVLFPALGVDSASWGNGNAATYFRGKKSPFLWVDLGSKSAVERKRTLTLFYHGDLIGDDGTFHYILSSAGWYPSPAGADGLQPATFDMTFHTPAKLTFVASGTKASSETNGKTETSRWVAAEPVPHMSFNLGKFTEYEINYQGLQPTTVLMAEWSARPRPKSGLNMESQVGADIVNSLTFFQQAFGSPPAPHFYATEIPFGHGQAFPGLVHLSWATFFEQRKPGADEVFRAHEMAHQWWGLGVGSKTYHDEWLAEGMSEFTALWYLETTLNQRDTYLELLEKYRKEIFEREDEAGPVWLGRRVNTSTTPNDYSIITYKKGAWVLHMLRSFIRDATGGTDDVFSDLMRDFYASYVGKKASTDDFRETVEKHLGLSMGWFFDQWLHGTELPTYEFSYKTEQLESGDFATKIRIEQQGVSETFKMYVPIELDLGSGKTTRFPVLVTGTGAEADLPHMSVRPKKIRLNPDEAVLARVKNVKWQEK